MRSKRSRLIAGMFVVAICLSAINASAALALSPSVETLAASAIGETGTTLNGKVNPNGAETKMYFEYGTTTAYGSKTAEVNLGSGSTTLEKAEAISGLAANTLYHFRIVATNSSGTSQGVDKTFTTVGAPTGSGVTFSEIGGLGEETTLKATVDPNGQSTTYQFEYGLTEGSLTNLVPVPAGSAGSGYEPVSVDAVATGLTPGTRYYVRVTATNASGKASSSVTSFLSSAEPGISGVSATNISRTGAELKATIASNLFVTTYYFEYGTTTSYGTKTTSKEGNGAVSASLSGLKPSTLYHYRVVATNSQGTHTGLDQTFTTSKAVTLLSGGIPVPTGQSLEAKSANLTFAISGWTYSCPASEFTGTVTENPGALQSAPTAKLQNTGGTPCPAVGSPSMTAKFTLSAGITLDYGWGEFSTVVVRTSTFTFNLTYALGTFKLGECEFSLQLSGSYPLKSALAPTLSGEPKLIKIISGECPTGKMSGTFKVTSKGLAVEAA
jgi:hypothetical protein